MKDNILKSKLAIPRLPVAAIERRRLQRQINAADAARLVLLVAPAGYGKTTLARQVLDARTPNPVAWLHLDDHDSDAARFARYLIAALRDILPDDTSAGWGTDLHQVTENICLALERYGGPECRLVLDNWECVDSNPDICAVPLMLASHTGGKLRTIITSRVPPSFKVRRGQAQGMILRLDAGELAFTLPEWHEALDARLGREVEDGEAERTWKESSGWCVSVGLMPRQSTAVPFPKQQPRSACRKDGAFDEYVREELYDRLPRDYADFLCETSLFDVLTVDRCAAVATEKDRAEEFLGRLAASAIPHVALDQSGHYRLHSLVRQTFRAMLRRRPGRESDRLYRAAADRLLEEGQKLEAIELLMELADYDAALDLMGREWSDLFGRHGWLRVRQWLENLPGAYRDRPVYIKTFSNVLNVAGDNRGAIEFLRDRLSLDKFGDDVESFGSLWANYWWARINTEKGPHYEAALRAHAEVTAPEPGFSPTMLGIFQNTLGVAAYLELRLDDAIAHVRRSADLIEAEYPRLKLVATQNVALYSHLRGESMAALELLADCREECNRLELRSDIPRLLMLETNILLATGHYRRALTEVDRCVRAMRACSTYSLQLDAYLNRFRGLALWYLGDQREGLRLLAAAEEPAREFNAATGVEVALLREYYGLLGGRVIKDLDRIDAPGSNQPSEGRLIYLALRAVMALRARDRAGLRRFAGQIRDLAGAQGLPQWTATGSFLRAMALGQAHGLKDLLQEAFETLQTIGWRSYPMAAGEITSFAVAKAARLGIDASLFEPLLFSGVQIDLTPAFAVELTAKGLGADERIRLWDAAARLSVRGLSGPLKKHAAGAPREEQIAHDRYREFLSHGVLPTIRIETLGGFSVSSGGRAVRFSRSSARLLLQYLVVACPGKMHEEELLESLWPESDPDKGRANLRTAVRDLRRALDPYAVPRGPSHVVYEDQHYGLDLPGESFIDYQRFIDLARESGRGAANPSIPLGDRMAGLRAALEAYRGSFLPSLPYESFAVELRERLHAMYQQVSLRAAELLLEAKSGEEAIAVLERALAYDPLWTAGVRALLGVHAALGEVLKAMRVYRAYEKRLLDDLGLPPDPAIREYFDEIMKSPNNQGS